jgi:hypothetical protein
VIALARYTIADVLRSQRWVAPLLTFLGIDAVLLAGNGSVLPTYAVSAVALLFVSTWLTVVVVNVEDPLQETVTAVTAGGRVRPRLAKLVVAYGFATILAAVAIVSAPIVSTDGVSLAHLGAGIGAHLVTALAGVAVGALFSRPLVSRTAWAVLGGFALCLADVVIPGLPPGRQLLELFDGNHVHDLGLTLAAIAAETVLIAAVLVAGSQRLARARA